MKTHQAIASLLKQTMKHQKMPQVRLGREAGLSPRTLQLILSGEHDFKLRSLFAIADRLGLEMVLVPKEAAAAAEGGSETVAATSYSSDSTPAPSSAGASAAASTGAAAPTNEGTLASDEALAALREKLTGN